MGSFIRPTCSLLSLPHTVFYHGVSFPKEAWGALSPPSCRSVSSPVSRHYRAYELTAYSPSYPPMKRSEIVQLSTSTLLTPTLPHRNMMMYNPYLMMGQQGGFPGMGPMNAMMGMMGPGQMMSMNGMPGGGPMAQASQDGMKPYDSTQMKRGRNGHYGYLEGRGELVI